MLGYCPSPHVSLSVLHVAPAFQQLAKQTIISLSIAHVISNLKNSGAITYRPLTKGFLNGPLQ